MPNQQEKKHYEATWQSLMQFSVPQWFTNAKLGIFIHWGIYSVPAFESEWYSRHMYIEGRPEFKHHQEKWGHQSQFGYKDFIQFFKAEKFNADAWIDLFKRAGANYIVPVAEHHDGFAMYDSAHSKWTATKMGPMRDVIGELAIAAQKQDMRFGLSSHRAENWWFFNGGRKFDSDVQNPQYEDFYGPAKSPLPGVEQNSNEWDNLDWKPRPDAKFLDDWLARCCELVDKYHPQIIYFDGWINQAVFAPYLQKFAAYYYNRGSEWGKDVAILYKHESFMAGTAIYDVERGKLNKIRDDYWQTDTSISYKSWCYVENDKFKDVTTLVHDLVDVVSKNGNLLLNVGPNSDGLIPDDAANRLLGLGEWLRINGEAIYNTRHWHTFGEGDTTLPEGHMREHEAKPFKAQDIRFTTRDNFLYAICLGWPGKKALIKSLSSESTIKADQIEIIQMLGSDEQLTWTQDNSGLQISTPSQQPCDHAVTYKMKLKDL